MIILEKNLRYEETTDTYYVTFRFNNKSNMKAFPTLEDARKYRDDVNAEKLKYKTAKTLEAIRNEENKLIEESREIYPYNMLSSLSKISWYKDTEDYIESVADNVDYWNTLMESCLTPRECKACWLYYSDMNTLDKVGKELGITRERVRQIIQKSLRRLLLKVKHIVYDKEKESENERKNCEFKMLYEQRQELINALIKNGYLEEEKLKEAFEIVDEVKDVKDFNEVSIEELDLSNRASNCLKRHRIRTIGELLELDKEGVGLYAEIIRYRNMGKKSALEIVKNLNDYLEKNGGRENV